MTRLGKEIKKARIEKELSQPALEAVTGIPYRHLSAIERGDINPRWDTVVKLALALDLHLDSIARESHREAADAMARATQAAPAPLPTKRPRRRPAANVSY